MPAYYNEFDPYCAQWLRNLIDAGHIPAGDVDERSITEVSADEIREYNQWHFFAGIGGWAYAARLSGLPDDAPILTGSPPCQPFSSAGQRKGYADERHLAPVWLELVSAIRPAWVFGEQVAAAITKDNWLDDLLNELENQGYSTGALVLPACSVGAPHIRQRLWVVGRLADASSQRLQGYGQSGLQQVEERRQGAERHGAEASSAGRLADTANDGHAATENWRGVGAKQNQGWMQQSAGACDVSNRLADTERGRLQVGHESKGKTSEIRKNECNSKRTCSTQSRWNDPDWLYCRDGKWRPVESGTFPLAHGIPNRVGRLRAYGNAIVPQVAAEVIKEVMQ